MKKLPKIYQNNITKRINNNKMVSYVANIKENNIEKELNNVFSGYGYSYNIPLIIKTQNKTYDTSLVLKTNNYVVTLDNEIIPISNITSIIRKKY